MESLTDPGCWNPAVCKHPAESLQRVGNEKMYCEEVPTMRQSLSRSTDHAHSEPHATGRPSDSTHISGKEDRRDRETLLSMRTWRHEHASATTIEPVLGILAVSGQVEPLSGRSCGPTLRPGGARESRRPHVSNWQQQRDPCVINNSLDPAKISRLLTDAGKPRWTTARFMNRDIGFGKGRSKEIWRTHDGMFFGS